MRKLKVAVQMALASSNSRDGYWRIEVVDALSGTRICLLEMPPDQFGRALGSQYQSEVDAEVADAATFARVGLKRQTKHETVTFARGSLHGDGAMGLIRERALVFETDGWKLEPLGNYNHHLARHIDAQTDSYRVTLVRYVDPADYVPEPEPAPTPPAKPKGKTKKAR